MKKNDNGDYWLQKHLEFRNKLGLEAFQSLEMVELLRASISFHAAMPAKDLAVMVASDVLCYPKAMDLLSSIESEFKIAHRDGVKAHDELTRAFNET